MAALTMSSALAASGDLDPSFDLDGLAFTNIADDNSSAAAASTIQSDGKIVTVGTASNGVDGDFAVARWNADGTLDTSFGTGGKVVTDLGGSDGAASVALQNDGKLVLAGTTGGGATDFAVVRYNTDGSLDSSFGLAGVVTTDLGTESDQAFSVAIQADGKIVVAGGASNWTTAVFALARYNPDGSLDTTFDGDGILTTSVAPNWICPSFTYAYSVAIQTDGKIVAVGNSGSDFAVLRYNADGSLDTSFDSDGIVTTDFAGDCEHFASVAIQSDGKIVAAGQASYFDWVYYFYQTDISVVRYNTDGSLDTSFDNDGIVTTDIEGDWDDADSLAIQSDDEIVVTGAFYDPNSGGMDLTVVRYNTDGSLDATFEGDGIVTTDLGSSDDRASLAIQSDDKIVVTANPFAVLRYDTDGSLDASFSEDGVAMTWLGRSGDVSNAVAIQRDGKIVVAGTASRGETGTDFAVTRYNEDGSLDVSFDGDGIVTTDLGPEDHANAIAVQRDGKIVVAGDSRGFVVARYDTDGSLDASFDTDGIATAHFGAAVPWFEWATSVGIQRDGKIVAAGNKYDDYNPEFAVARFNSDGSLDTSFDEDGMATAPAAWPNATAMAIQSDGKIVVVGSAGGDCGDFAIVRFNPDGSLDTSFGSGGMTLTAFNPGDCRDDTANSLAIDSDGKIVVAGTTSWYDSNWDAMVSNFALARYKKNGTLDPSFDRDGKLTTDFGGATNFARSVLLQSEDRILVAGGAGNVGNSAFALARYKSNGSLDTSFQSGGKFVTDLGSGNDFIRSMAIQRNGRVVAVGEWAGADFAVARYLR